MSLASLLELMRPWQWYKNLLIFVAIIFARQLGNIQFYPPLLTGFLLLCLISSANYVINDLVDYSRDLQHPEKRRRPLPSGKVGKPAAMVLGAVLALAMLPAFWLNVLFGVSALMIFLTSQLYSFFLKRLAFVDLMTLSSNYVWRAVAGAFLIGAVLSPWLILTAFLLAVYLTICKRLGEVLLLGNGIRAQNSALSHYTPDLLKGNLTVISSVLIVAYGIYTSTVFDRSFLMIATFPIVIFLILRFNHFALQGHPMARRPEKAFKDKLLAAGLFAWLIVTILSLYLPLG